MDEGDVPIIACNDGIVYRDREQITPVKSVGGGARRPSTPGCNWKPGLSGRKSRDVDKTGRGSRIRSASAGRDPKSELTSRYWSYLFGNLERSISEIYDSCEKQDNVVQCKEVLLILENYVRDFNKLIEWLNLKWSYEQTPPPMRPNALAWEIRKPTYGILPHTTAYEKLVGIVSGSNKLGLQKLPTTVQRSETLSTMPPNSICNSKSVPTETTSIPSLHSELSNAKSENDNKNKDEESVCVFNDAPSEIKPFLLGGTNIVLECVSTLTEDNRVNVSLQTDFHDPDIYYIAGGRIIACQTDPSEEYGPLIPISSEASPVIIVLDQSDSDGEASMIMDKSMTISNTSSEVNVVCSDSTNLNNPIFTHVMSESSSSTTKTSQTMTESCPSVIITESNASSTNNPTNNNNDNTSAFGSIVETKSSSTQLSAGVLIEETVIPESQNQSPSTDGSGDCNIIPAQDRVITSIKGTDILETATSVTTSGPESKTTTEQIKSNNGKTTFADKARNGMLRQNSMQAKSVPNNINRIGTGGSGTAKGTTSGPITSGLGIGQRGKNPPSYRSNIASRCRTAVNTNKQQVSPVKTKLCSSLSSSDTLSSLNNPSIVLSSNKKSHSFSRSNVESGQIKSPTNSLSSSSTATTSATTTKRTTFTSNNSPSSNSNKVGSGSTKTDGSGDKKKYITNVANAARQGSSSTRQSENNHSQDGRLGMVRSKSMINPPSSSLSSRRSQHSNNNSASNNRFNNFGKKPQPEQKTQPNRSFQTKTKPGNESGSSKYKNFVSLPDVSVHRKRNSTVDEDGWETVRARSNRTKWSPSGSSLSIPLVSDGNCSSSSSIHNHSHNHIPTGPPSWKDVDEEGAKEDEEIKRKEEDLDNAIREEELIEEELRQVEKDFEMIENESRDDTTTSENDNAPSPDGTMHPLAEMDIEKEQFFFICMDDEAGAKAEEFPPREPGRIVALREKLMSPAKRCDSAETLRKYQAKLAKAERNREKLLQAKFNRYVELSERFETLNETTKKLVSEREELISKAEARLKRAAENRKQHLQNIVKKAHDEDAKAKEIAFINLLEAQNKRHDYLATAHEIEGRLQTIQEERRLKLEERASKALSVIQRQSRIRNNWQSKLERMQEKRRKAEERITREKEEKAKERSELAQEKARDREERISALNAAKQAEKEELQKKIQQKQEDTARRHEENMEQIRQKAIELSVPRSPEDITVPAIVRVCTLCKVALPSEVQELAHLRGRAHIDAVKRTGNLNNSASNALENFGIKYVCDLQMDKIDFKLQVDKNRFKTLKKHCKKLMQKLVDSGLEYEKIEKETMIIKTADPDLKAKIHKNIKELDRLVTLFENKKGSPALAMSMDRLMTDIRKTSVKVKAIKDIVISLGAVTTALRVLKCSADDLPDKIRISACNLVIGINYDSKPNIMHCLRGTVICSVIEFCAERLNSLIPEGNRWIAGSTSTITEQIPYDPVLESVLELLFGIINIVPDPFHGIGKEGFLDKPTLVNIKNRVMDIIGYLVASSVIDRFSIYCSAVRGPIEDQPQVADLLKMILDFLIMNIYALEFCWSANVANGKKDLDTTQLLVALEASELAGAVSMSYTLLLHQGAPTRPRMTPGVIECEEQPVPPPPGERTVSIVSSTLLLINAMAKLDHQALQNVLGSESVSLQFRHIASQLLWQGVPHREDNNVRRLLNELLIAIAYFTVGNKHNQATIQSGQTPTVLQQLCRLPQEFFKDIKYIKLLFPTLITATYGCPENIEILVQNNIDLQALQYFMHSNLAHTNDPLRKLKLLPTSTLTDMLNPSQDLGSSNGNNNNDGKQKRNSNNEESQQQTQEVPTIESNGITVVPVLLNGNGDFQTVNSSHIGNPPGLLVNGNHHDKDNGTKPDARKT